MTDLLLKVNKNLKPLSEFSIRAFVILSVFLIIKKISLHKRH